MYDSVTIFDEIKGDLFSLGLVALQLFYLNQEISMLYVNPNPSYRNYSIDMQRLASLVQSIYDFPLRNAIEILTAGEPKKRMAIYDRLTEINCNERELSILNKK